MLALIVDDSRTIRRLLARTMTALGYEVTEAADGQEALARLAEGIRPSVALVDWNMPNLDGLGFVTQVRQDAQLAPQFASMKIVMVTTEVEQHQMIKALEAGADEYIMKPFTP